MAGNLRNVIDRLLHARTLRRWRVWATQTESLSIDSLRDLRLQARQLRRQVDRVLHTAEGRLALPMIGTNAIRRMPGADWAWRPDFWRGPVSTQGHAAVESRTQLTDGTTIFHDCRISEITCRQVRNTREQDLAPFGLRMDVFHFDGSFLSLVVDLPDEAVQGLRLRHLIRVEVIVELEKPLEIFARLNIKHGPNVEQVVRELPLGGPDVIVEFDLFYTRMNEKRVEKAWIDLIFEGPELNQIVLRDLTISRRPRADL
ncbi:MAG: DUF6478 family protein [Gemmobacter sp.]|nr:DUF6478 family protein [Gemmobacter sp.]